MDKKSNFFVFGILFVLGHFNQLAFAQSESEIKESISAAISMRHPEDSGNWWRSLGDSAPKVILEMYSETDNIYQKVRLVDALSWYDNPIATDFLKQLSEDNTNQVLKNSALESLIRSQGLKEKEHIERALSSEDTPENTQTKAVVVKALSTLDEPDADKLVDRHVHKNHDEWVLSRVKKSRARREQLRAARNLARARNLDGDQEKAPEKSHDGFKKNKNDRGPALNRHSKAED